MNCDDSGEIGGAGCVLLADHPGDHETIEGATWLRLVEQDCPGCGALMYTADPDGCGDGPCRPSCKACQQEAEQ